MQKDGTAGGICRDMLPVGALVGIFQTCYNQADTQSCM